MTTGRRAQANTDRATTGGTSRTVRSVHRAVSVLNAFTAGRPHLTLSEVASIAGLDRATTRRLLLTLIECGLVRQDVAKQRYGLTLEVLRFGAAVADLTGLRKLAGPVLAALAQETRSTVFLSIYRERAAVCVERIHNGPVQVRLWSIGEALPVNCGAAPRVLLAYQPEAEQRSALAGTLPRLTPLSITDASALRQRLQAIRARGWELAVDDVAEGLSAVAAPIFDGFGGIVAAVSISGTTPQILAEAEPRHVDRLQAAARQISDELARSA